MDGESWTMDEGEMSETQSAIDRSRGDDDDGRRSGRAVVLFLGFIFLVIAVTLFVVVANMS